MGKIRNFFTGGDSGSYPESMIRPAQGGGWEWSVYDVLTLAGKAFTSVVRYHGFCPDRDAALAAAERAWGLAHDRREEFPHGHQPIRSCCDMP